MSSIDREDRNGAIRESVRHRRDDLVELLQTLVRYRSENPKLLEQPERQEAGRQEEAACQEFMSEQFRDLGMKVDSWDALPGRADVVGTLEGAGGGSSLILNGHIDVVPAGNVNDWPRDPWSAEIVDRQLWGRGSCDMKGGVAAGLGALTALRDAGIQLQGDIVFESVVDEETGGPGTRSAVERGYLADGAIVLEPTSGALVPVQGGLYWLNVIVRGRGGHSGARYRSIHAGGRGEPVSAIEKAVKLLTAIGELERRWGNVKTHPLMPLGITTINPGVIAGGSGRGEDGLPGTFKAYSNMADYCVLGLSLKYLPQEDGDEVRREFEDFISRVAATDPWLSEHPPEVQWNALGLHFPPCDTPLDHPLVVAAAAAYQDVIGDPVWSGYEAVTDLGFLAEVGVRGLIYGPGSIPRSHGTSEYIELDDFFTATEVVAITVADFCGVA